MVVTVGMRNEVEQGGDARGYTRAWDRTVSLVRDLDRIKQSKIVDEDDGIRVGFTDGGKGFVSTVKKLPISKEERVGQSGPVPVRDSDDPMTDQTSW